MRPEWDIHHTEVFRALRDQTRKLDFRDGAQLELLRAAREFNVHLAHLNDQLSELDEHRKMARCPTFDGGAEERRYRQMEILSTEINRRVSALLEMIRRQSAPRDSDELQIWANLQQSQKIRLGDVVSRFRCGEVKRQESVPEADAISEMYADFHPQLSDEQVAVVQREADMAREQQELERVQQRMEEVSGMFRDLSLLIFDQGTILDRVDVHVRFALEQVQAGTSELEVADEHDASHSRCMRRYLAFVALGIFICLCIMVIRML